MQTTQFFRHLLGLTSPWSVQRVAVSPEEKTVDVWLAHRRPFSFPCPECGAELPIYDHTVPRSWHHVDSGGFLTWVHARIPRVRCLFHGRRQILIPWSPSGEPRLVLVPFLLIASRQFVVSFTERLIMARRPQRDRSKEQHWRHHLTAWRRSGLTVRAYCRAQGLSEPSFYAWRRTLLERRHTHPADRTADPTHPSPTAAASAFLPVRLVDPLAVTPPVEVVLRGGRLLRVTPGFSPATVRELVAVLEDLPC